MDFARWDTILIHHETDEKNQRFRLLVREDRTLGRGRTWSSLDGLIQNMYQDDVYHSKPVF